jgi:hypothetical protein
MTYTFSELTPCAQTRALMAVAAGNKSGRAYDGAVFNSDGSLARG